MPGMTKSIVVLIELPFVLLRGGATFFQQTVGCKSRVPHRHLTDEDDYVTKLAQDGGNPDFLEKICDTRQLFTAILSDHNNNRPKCRKYFAYFNMSSKQE